MRWWRRWVCVVLACLVLPQSDTQARPPIEVGLGGGTLFPYDAVDQVGNDFGAFVLVHLDIVAIGAGGAVVLPDSQLQGKFGTIWAEARLHPWRKHWFVRPYATVAVGLATGDTFDASAGAVDPVRWNPDGVAFLVLAGLGAQLGNPEGMQLALDVRTVNHTHLGLSLAASFVF